LALAALALVVFGAYDSYRLRKAFKRNLSIVLLLSLDGRRNMIENYSLILLQNKNKNFKESQIIFFRDKIPRQDLV